MKTNHITKVLRKYAKKLDISVNRSAWDGQIATYTFSKESNVEGLFLEVQYDVKVEAYDRSFVKPLIDMSDFLLQEQQNQMDQEITNVDPQYLI